MVQQLCCRGLMRLLVLQNWYWSQAQNAAGYTAGDPVCFFGGIWMLYRQNDIDVASCAQGVCILKETARMLIERGEV